jgi:hypothetical protein
LESNKKNLNYISDEELQKQLKILSRLVRNSKFSEKKRVQLEIEICYLQKESMIRETRKRSHQEYLGSVNSK